MPTHALTTSSEVIYECESCGSLHKAATVFQADKPNGFWIDLRKITGEKYRHHYKTPEPVFYCTKECLINGMQFQISHIVQPTEPIGLDELKKSPWDGSRRR